MHYLFNLLQRSRAVASWDILHFIDEENIQLFHARVILKNDSVLFVRELITDKENKYSYHWQTENNKLICRWDNAPHYSEIATFPYHKHEKTQSNVSVSKTVSLGGVLKIIEEKLKQR